MFGCRRISSWDNTPEIILPWCVSLHCDPDINMENNKTIFHHGMWLMIMQYHTMFGFERFNGFKRYHLRNICWKFEPFLWPWPWRAVQSFHYIWACGDVPPNKARLKNGQQLIRYIQTVLICVQEPSLWPWPWWQQLNLFKEQSGSWWCITMQSCGSEWSSSL